MSAYQSNVKVEQLAEGGSARTPGSIVASSTTSGNKESAPPTPSLPAGGAFTSSRPEAAATGAAPWAAERSEQRSWVKGRSALAAGVMIDGLAAIITPSRLLGVLNDDRTTTFI